MDRRSVHHGHHTAQHRDESDGSDPFCVWKARAPHRPVHEPLFCWFGGGGEDSLNFRRALRVSRGPEV
jgi:hypothetical protein